MEALELRVETEFEECLEFKWNMANGKEEALVDSTVEMVIDRSNGTGPCRPAKDAMVKRVPMGAERKGCVQNMPDSRHFLIAVAGKLRNGAQVRSPWVRAATLNPSTRENTGNLDPNSMPRKGCKLCPCLGYVPQKFELNAAEKMRCRRCGCGYSDHLLLEVTEILQSKEDKFRRKLKEKDKKEELTPLPVEAVDWDNRECALWFQSDGLFHPRSTVGLHRPPLPEAAKSRPGGAEGLAGKKGRVSVMTPTLESRQKFHRTLWACFVAQEWPDKELVVVETYVDQPSEFLAQTAAKDPRLVYVRYKRERGADWSIGVKRNMCAHLATGEFIANFDDDDLYAPSYLSTMVPQLGDRTAHAVTLSSWYIFETKSSKWGFCDAIAWGWQRGMDGDHQDVKSWAYGYGFSYVHRRQDLMTHPYEDMNMGEDYSFVSRLLGRIGERAVHLFHDEFGICLHTQHGENTSNAFPVREVGYEEAGDLDVADLPREVVGDYLSQVGGALAAQGRGHRTLTAHTLEGAVFVPSTPGTTVEAFLQRLAEVMPGDARGSQPLRAYRVPVLDLPKDEERQGSDEWLAELLGFELEEPLGEEHGEEARAKVRAQKRRMMAQARRPMHVRDRISLRVRHLWVAPASLVEEEEELDFGLDRESFGVEVTVQRTDAKSSSSVGNAIQVRLPVGSTVAGLRELLGDDLPRRARVLAERPGRGPVPLQDEEPVPDRVAITEFKGSKSFYMLFSKSQCAGALTMLKRFFSRREVQARLDKIEEACGGGFDSADFRGKLSSLLINEVYPPIFRHFGLPEGSAGSRHFMNAMGQVTASLELVELWLEVETLMRNAMSMRAAKDHVERLRAAAGLAGP